MTGRKQGFQVIQVRKSMSIAESIFTCFRKSFDFRGRAQRAEYWWFAVFQIVLGLATSWSLILGSIVSWGLLLPILAVTARRLHDTGRTGWLALIYVLNVLTVPLINLINPVFVVPALASLAIILILCAMPGESGPNKYGPDPLAEDML